MQKKHILYRSLTTTVTLDSSAASIEGRVRDRKLCVFYLGGFFFWVRVRITRDHLRAPDGGKHESLGIRLS